MGEQQPQVDDECHMVFECKKFEDLRGSERFALLFQRTPHGDVRSFMEQESKMLVAQFIHNCMEEVDKGAERVQDTRPEQP